MKSYIFATNVEFEALTTLEEFDIQALANP